jgi:nucleotide-binding universal stress UspA family protein
MAPVPESGVIALRLDLQGTDGTEFEYELIAGSPAEAIARVAEVRDADEIVVGSRGFGALRATLGSVSHELLHHADRPVVVIPRRMVEQNEPGPAA